MHYCNYLTIICHWTYILISCCCQPYCIHLYLKCIGIYRGKAEDKMTTAVQKKDEELTINLKCIIDVLMTGLYLI